MMLLANAPRTTDDIDLFWVEEGDDFQKARLVLRDGVQTIASKYMLPPNWFNYLTQLLIYDKIILPKGKLWKRYGPLYVYAPPREYALALKILAGRDKDIADCRILLPQTSIRTRKSARKVVDRYVLPDAQQDDAKACFSLQALQVTVLHAYDRFSLTSMEHFAIQHKVFLELFWLKIHCPTLLRHIRII